nr:histidinol dehydrogenase [Promicromonospora thailandica]
MREGGAAALRQIAQRFDGVAPEHLRVPAAALTAAVESLTPLVREGLEEAIRRVRRVHAAQLPADHVTELAPGAAVRQRWIPVQRVGLYAPGGLAVYPSSVVMNVVAAQEAGVPGLAVASPPQKDNGGLPHPTILAACALLGVDEVYAVGGAQAVAMFAYGAAGSEPQDGATLCEPVDVVTGPGNVYVAAAKRLVRGVVGIDAEAGPTEIAVLADATADPGHVALDLISQAEHDPMAASVLVTDSVELASAVEARVQDLASATKHAVRVARALEGPQSAVVLVDDVDAGLAVVNAYGAEHLEIQTADADAVAARVHSAGAIFVGPWSPVSLGDYMAGSNHVLPTGGTAHFASGLGVHSFLKSVQQVEYGRDALAELADRIVAVANDEDLPAHGEAVRGRFH